MVLSLNYRRPGYVDSSRTSVNTEKTEGSHGGESISSSSSCPYGIPEALSFEKIISGGTCPVCSSYHPSIVSKLMNTLARNHARVHGLSSLH